MNFNGDQYTVTTAPLLVFVVTEISNHQKKCTYAQYASLVLYEGVR